MRRWVLRLMAGIFLATVIVGGMTVCGIFTLLLLPSLLRFGKVRTSTQAQTEVV